MNILFNAQGLVARGVNFMALLSYLKYKDKDGLPNPKGSLSEKVLPFVIEKANAEVRKVLQLNITEGTKRRGAYKRLVASYY